MIFIRPISFCACKITKKVRILPMLPAYASASAYLIRILRLNMLTKGCFIKMKGCFISTEGCLRKIV
ncbi:MAG: hypothetical protein LBL74_04275 [Bacteroidales bacterium]|nr:hypothetical protein [Bacteroidales bacterium]